MSHFSLRVDSGSRAVLALYFQVGVLQSSFPPPFTFLSYFLSLSLCSSRFDASGLSIYRSALCACVVKDIPNVRDYVYKPEVTATKRKRPSSKPSGADNDASATTSSPEGTTPQPAQQPDDNLLNQLA